MAKGCAVTPRHFLQMCSLFIISHFCLCISGFWTDNDLIFRTEIKRGYNLFVIFYIRNRIKFPNASSAKLQPMLVPLLQKRPVQGFLVVTAVTAFCFFFLKLLPLQSPTLHRHNLPCAVCSLPSWNMCISLFSWHTSALLMSPSLGVPHCRIRTLLPFNSNEREKNNLKRSNRCDILNYANAKYMKHWNISFYHTYAVIFLKPERPQCK